MSDYDLSSAMRMLPFMPVEDVRKLAARAIGNLLSRGEAGEAFWAEPIQPGRTGITKLKLQSGRVLLGAQLQARFLELASEDAGEPLLIVQRKPLPLGGPIEVGIVSGPVFERGYPAALHPDTFRQQTLRDHGLDALAGARRRSAGFVR